MKTPGDQRINQAKDDAAIGGGESFELHNESAVDLDGVVGRAAEAIE